MRPLFFDGFTGFFEVFEVGTAEVLVLLNVEPEIEDIFCAFSLQKQTGSRSRIDKQRSF